MSTWFGMLLGSQRRASATDSGYPAVRTEAAAALTAGIRVLVAPEHLHAEPYRMLRPWPLLAALRADLGEFHAVGSVIAGVTSATQLAGDLATVREIGTGEVDVALAAGYHRDDFTAAGRPFADRFRLRAELRAAVVAWGATPWSAAMTVTAARRATEDGAVWYGGPGTTPETTARITEITGPGVLRRDVLLGATDTEVRAGWERYVAPKYGAYASWGFADGAAQVIAGTPEQVVDRLGAVITVAPRGIVVRLCWPDMAGPVAADHVRAFGERVLPHLDARSRGRG